ncbi:MAG: hypothetical protein ACKO2G_04620 [Verrucomicrobiales bacterium]
MKIQPEKPAAKRSALASATADMREMRNNSRETMAELQAFLRELKGKSPQEMLGIVAGSQLVRCLGLSTALIAGTILIFTAIPYFLAKDEAPVAAQPAAATVPAAPAQPTVPAAPETPPAEVKPAAPSADALSNLGIGGEISAPPDKNPLESRTDDFLKDLE